MSFDIKLLATDLMSGRTGGPHGLLGRAVLRGCSWGYFFGLQLKHLAYRSGIFSSFRAEAPVVCVGNLTTGGTGKTPMVQLVVEKLLEKGFHPAVLTRGYASGRAGSDEALQLGAALPDVAVVINPDRRAGARKAVQAGANVLVMDDGFQHRRLQRNLDIVLIDATNPFGYGYLLPRGMLREPPGALRRAGAIVITRCDQASAEQVEKLRGNLISLSRNIPVVTAQHKPVSVYEHGSGEELAFADLSGKRVAAFSGTGNPEAFGHTLRKLGAELVYTKRFPDHYPFSAGDVDRVCADAVSRGAEIVVMTEKDAVKIKHEAMRVPVLHVLRVEMELLENAEALWSVLYEAVGAPPATE